MARKSNKRNKREQRERAQYRNDRNDSVVNLQEFMKPRNTKVEMIPRNVKQEEYIDILHDDRVDIAFAVGPAGTGKTLLAVRMAIKLLKSRDIEKIVITRPAVSVDEQHGFLPGTLVEKMAPWTRPIMDEFAEYYTPTEIEKMMEEGIIEVCPLAYMRGRTFRNAYIIGDEFQNCTVEQVKMCLTRIGDNSSMIITGDLRQSDRGFENNGLKDVLTRIKRSESNRIRFVEFEVQDVERHPVVAEVLGIYGDVD